MPSRQPWSDIEIPESVSRIPAQLSREETQYLMWLAESEFQGRGKLVELGTLLGGSSAALAEGLRRRGGDDKVIALDHFVWWGDPLRPEGVADGDDFMEHYLANVRAFDDRIDARRADLREARYDEGPIEILFVDAAKDWGLMNAVLRVFGPSLIPNESRIVFQDYRHFTAYHIPLAFEGHDALWEEIECVDSGWTVTFRATGKDTLAWCAKAAFSESMFPWRNAWPLFERRIAKCGPEHADWHRLGAMVKALVDREVDDAGRLCDAVRSAGRIQATPIARAEVVAARRFQAGALAEVQAGHAAEIGAALPRIRSAATSIPESLRVHVLEACDAIDGALSGTR